MTARRLWLLAATGAALCVLVGVWFWRYIEEHRPRAAAATADYAAPGTQRLLTGMIFRDCGLSPSPDGRYAAVAVRRRDTSGDGRITARDAKSMLLLDCEGDTAVLCEGQLVWQDKPVRWSPDGKLLALALPAATPGWTHYDPTDMVVYDPAARREIARYPHGINPLWLQDGRLAFQRNNSICVVTAAGVAELPPPPEIRDRQLLRSFVHDPWRQRIIAAYSGVADVRLRDDAMLTEGKLSVLFAWTETATGWQARRLPWDGYAPRPAADGLYYFARRGDISGNGTYELVQDGVDLMCDGRLLAGDVAFNSFFDYSGLRTVLVRRPGYFDLVELGRDGVPGPVLLRKLVRHGGTWLAHGYGHTVLSAIPDAGGTVPALFEASPAWSLTKLADGPVTQPFVTARGVYCLRAAGAQPGELLFIPFDS